MTDRRKKIIRKKRREMILVLCIRYGLLLFFLVAAFSVGHYVGSNSMRSKMLKDQRQTLANVGDQTTEGDWSADSETTQGSGTMPSADAGGAGSEGNGNVGTSMENGESIAANGISSGDISWIWEEAPVLLLVNKDHKLPDDYKVELVELPDGTNHAAKIAYKPLTDMLKAGRKEGLSFEVCSSYRSVERQQELLDEDIDALMRKGYSYEDAYDEVTMETMPPGYSEHSTGLAFDIVALSYQILDRKQAQTRENIWLKEHCAEYGFILRYPEDKTDITGISYESWHFRYVGVDAAAYIMENDLTLEEYLEELAEEEFPNRT